MNQIKSQSNHPFVSVVIPFFNNQEEVVQVEKSLQKQTYPVDKFEIIFINNGSTRSFKFSESFLERSILLKEDEYLNSPYSARNRGVEVSKGEIVAFIDANSTPEENWLEEGVRCFENSESDLIGGSVEFDFQNSVTAGKIVDALTSITMQKAIQERGAAYTANLFVKKQVFEEVGLFEEGVRSGGDVRWTLKAKELGFKIVYCKSAMVKKYARSAKELYRKKIRTGRGYYHSWKQEPENERRSWFYNLMRSLKPPTLSKIKQMNPDRYHKEFDKKLVSIWFHVYASGILEQLAFLSAFFKKNEFNKKR